MKIIELKHLEILLIEPSKQFKGVIQILHGMMEYKERYLDLMKTLSLNGYVCVIHDHAGHGKNAETLGYFGLTDGWVQLISDTKIVSDYCKEHYPNLPHIILGHSMGSMVARSFFKRYPMDVDGLILTGAPNYDPLSSIAQIAAKLVLFFKGSKYPSKTLNQLFFINANKRYKDLGWLSSSASHVKIYIEDPLCGQLFTTSGYYYVAKGMKDMHDYSDLKLVKPQTPILFIAGEDDPIIGGESGLQDSMNVFREKGFNEVTNQVYVGKRHEILLETNDEEVHQKMILWLNKHFVK